MNRVYLSHIKATSSKDSGYVLSDDYARETQFIDGTPTDDIDLLKFVVKNCNADGSDILNFCKENERGIDINDTFYPYKDIESILQG